MGEERKYDEQRGEKAERPEIGREIERGKASGAVRGRKQLGQ